MTTTELLEKLLAGDDLTMGEATQMMTSFMDGNTTNSQMAALLVALRQKGESVDEISACAKVMREKSTKIEAPFDPLLDTCGTGGDGSGSINVSTAVALLLAGGGYKVAKHGNRSMTSKCGSADLLEALGVNINLSPQQVAVCIDKAGIGFLFAPALHSSMKNVMPVRKELGIRTVFNLLGPLTNPADAKVQIIGLYTPDLVTKIIQVLKALGSTSAYVFSGLNGLDEVSIEGDTKVAQLMKSGDIKEFTFNPESYAFAKALLTDIKGGSPEENAATISGVFRGDITGAKSDVIVLNAGFAISAADDCPLDDGFAKAREFMSEGTGLKAIERLKEISNSY